MNSQKQFELPIDFNLLLDYVDGKLDRPTTDKVEAHLQEDEKSSTIVSGIKSFYEQNGHDRNKLKQYIADSEQRIKERIQKAQQSTPPKKKQIYLFLSVAASVVILICASAYFFYSQPTDSTTTEVTAYLQEPYPAPDIFRDKISVRQQWITEYEKGSYASAAHMLQTLIAAGKGDSETTFYAGLSLLFQENPNYPEAIDYFQSISESTSIYQPVATWYLALSYYRSGQHEKARTILKDVVVDKENPMQDEAKSLMKELK